MNSFWAGRRVLVTGHTGFKGAWLCLWLQRLGADVVGIALEPEETDAAFGCLGPWVGLEHNTIDIRDLAGIGPAIARANPQIVFHLAAQAFVRRGYADPITTYAVNVLGTANVLSSIAKLHGLEAVVVVTSDKVYAPIDLGRPFQESDPLGGIDPYSSSKSCAEHVSATWRALGALPLATARAGNVIGGGDHGEDRLLPDLWRALTRGDDVRLRYPNAIRPWQHVLEPLSGYLLLAERLATGSDDCPTALNFGPTAHDDATVAAVADRVLELWGTGRWVLDEGIHPPESLQLRLDSGLAQTALRWRQRLTLETALAWTVEWWTARTRLSDLRELAFRQIDTYSSIEA